MFLADKELSHAQDLLPKPAQKVNENKLPNLASASHSLGQRCMLCQTK